MPGNIVHVAMEYISSGSMPYIFPHREIKNIAARTPMALNNPCQLSKKDPACKTQGPVSISIIITLYEN